jgi:hypothetical protein
MASTLNPSIRRLRAAFAAAVVVAGLAVAGSVPARAVPYRSNDRGQIVGGYRDAGGKVRGLLLDRGAFTAFDAPDAVSETGALDINDRRQIVGVFR